MDSHIRTSQLDQELQGRKRDQDSEAEGGGKRGVSRGREGQGEELAGGQGEREGGGARRGVSRGARGGGARRRDKKGEGQRERVMEAIKISESEGPLR